MTLRILILEDDKGRTATFFSKLSRHTLVFVATAADAISLIKNEVFDVIFLDHDLGGETFVSVEDRNTGSEVIRLLVSGNEITKRPYIIIHSLNTPAADSMQKTLVNNGFEFVYRIPFTQLVSQYLDDPSFLQ